jgi:hypothetical protein
MRQYEVHIPPAIMGGYYLTSSTVVANKWMPVVDYTEFEDRVREFKASLVTRVGTNNFSGIMAEFTALFPEI